jgi:hypothetical protein
MPNWCFNSLTIEGSEADITAIKQQLNQPYTRFFKDTWNRETNQFEEKNVTYSNPIFSFWNIIKPTDLEAYSKQAEHKLGEPINFNGDNWYDWNVRNWGTKWDVAVHDGDEYPETELMTDTKDTLAYRFNTAWSPPAEAITKLSQQYPDCEMSLSYEEETGWGGEIIFANGEGTEIEHYENKCRDCDSINTLDYCENGCGEICSSCMYMGEADEECVAECEVHREYLPVD